MNNFTGKEFDLLKHRAANIYGDKIFNCHHIQTKNMWSP